MDNDIIERIQMHLAFIESANNAALIGLTATLQNIRDSEARRHRIAKLLDSHIVTASTSEPDIIHSLEKRICNALGIDRVKFTYFAKPLRNGWTSVEYTGSNGMKYTLVLCPETVEGA